MSFFSSYSSSTATNYVSKVAPRQMLIFLYPAEPSKFSLPVSRQGARRQVPSRIVWKSTPELEGWFFTSLARAGHCQKHSPRLANPINFFSSQRPDVFSSRRQTHNVTFYRRRSTDDANVSAKGHDSDNGQNHSKGELLDLVDQYDMGIYRDQPSPIELPPRYQPNDGPNITVSDKEEDEWPPPHFTWPSDSDTKSRLAELAIAVEDKTLGADSEGIYQLYRALPNPRAPYLEAKLRHKFLRHLYTVEYKDETSMLRYLSVVDDLKKSAIPLTTTEWNSAISFAARYVNRSTETEVEAALHLFREMEHIAGVKGNGVTFNILYDVACKAGKFTLAEMIYNEMALRGIQFDRFHHVSLIYYHGLKRNGDGARAAYKDLVEAGEMVDTVVLNAMIAALIRSQEAQAAENIYERMKKIHFTRNPGGSKPPRDFLAQRRVTRTLQRMALLAKNNALKREQLQGQTDVAPDLQTYRILINYFAIIAGELNRTAKLLDEMKWFKVPLHGALFLALFKGFSIHGGVRYTHWTQTRLESVWKSYCIALADETAGLFMSQWLAVWVLRAFAKCAGKARTAAVWAEIRTKWTPTEMELDFVLRALRSLMEGPDAASKNDWLLGSI